MLFRYKGFDIHGKNVLSSIEASTLNEAKQKIKQKKIICVYIEEKKIKRLSPLSFEKKKVSSDKLSLFSRDLSIYLKSGISLVKAISLLKDRFKNEKQMKNFLEVIETYLEEGKDFFTALDQQKIFSLPEFYKQSIKVSESSGLLEKVLLELSGFLKEQNRIKKQISSAMAYPLFILIVSFFMVGFMLSVVVPKITDIFVKQNNELPMITKIVIKLGDFASNNYMYILILFLILGGCFFTFLRIHIVLNILLMLLV